jgi:nucleoside-diphosphate-sugar epimerase
MRYLVTGSSGFIGSNLVFELSKNKSNIIYALDRKNPKIKKFNVINLKKDLKNVKKFPNVDIIYHLAAYNGTKFFYEKPIEVIEDNFVSTINLVKFYKNKNIKLFVYSGTSETVAGANKIIKYKIPTDEKCPIILEDIYNPRWSYANSKTASEQLVALSGMPFMILRYFNVFGKNQKDHFIPEFIDRLRKKKFILYGYKNTRTFIYLTDAIKATIKLSKSKQAYGQIINIGGKDEIKIINIAKIIMKMNGQSKDIIKLKKLSAPEGSPMRRKPDIKKAEKLIGNFNKISLVDGIKEVLNLK